MIPIFTNGVSVDRAFEAVAGNLEQPEAFARHFDCPDRPSNWLLLPALAFRRPDLSAKLQCLSDAKTPIEPA